MKPSKHRSLWDWMIALAEGGARTTVGCFIVGIVFLAGVGIMSGYHSITYHDSPSMTGPPVPTPAGPRVPIPSVPSRTIMAGRAIYFREGCNNCHTLAETDGRDEAENSNFAPDLTHEGQRNASIAWQITNLRDHDRLFPNSIMGNYDYLTPRELKVLASYMATRR